MYQLIYSTAHEHTSVHTINNTKCLRKIELKLERQLIPERLMK